MKNLLFRINVLTAWAALVLMSCTPEGNDTPEGGIALSFDDRFIEDWYRLRPLLQEFDARVTFYITADTLTGEELRQLRELEADGHEIGFHGTVHGNARQMVRTIGVEGYLKTEIEPGMDYLRRQGFAPASYAHPGGNNTAKSDSALLAYGFVNLRDVAKAERYYKGVRLYHVPPAYMAHIYYRFNNRRKLQALQIDRETRLKTEEMKEALEKARNDRSVLMLFGHQPLPEDPPPAAYGFDVNFLRWILEESSHLGLRYYTMSELQPPQREEK